MSGSDLLAITSLLTRALACVRGIFDTFMLRTGMAPLWLFAVSVVAACRFILAPILGGALGQIGSDFVRGKSRKEG